MRVAERWRVKESNQNILNVCIKLSKIKIYSLKIGKKKKEKGKREQRAHNSVWMVNNRHYTGKIS